MKKIALLTSLLALLSACGGGSGSTGSNTNTPISPDIPQPEPDGKWTNDTVITQDMLRDKQDAQSLEIQKKLSTIKYVEDNLGSLLENQELTGISDKTNRSATTDQMLKKGLKISSIESRYQQALLFFDVVKKVVNANSDSEETKNLTNKDIKIAYSLSANKPFDKINQTDLPGINIEKTAEGEIIDITTFFSNIQITIKDKIETNKDLKENATNDIIKDIPVLEKIEHIDPNAAIINPNLLQNVKNIEDLQSMFSQFSQFVFKIDSDGKIIAINMENDESLEQKEGKFTLNRHENSAYFETSDKVWFFDFVVCNQQNICEEKSLEGLSKKYTDRQEIIELIKYKFEHTDNNISQEERQRVYDEILNLSDEEFDKKWTGIKMSGTLQSLGKINGLKYSDFGHYTIDDFHYTWTYQGGIEDKKIDPSNMPQNEKMVFHGTAVGELQSNNYDTEGKNTIEIKDNNRFITTAFNKSTLTFDKGTETLNMPFDNWYTINVVKNGDYVDSIKFTGDENKIDPHWQVYTKEMSYTHDHNCVQGCHDIPERSKWWDTQDGIRQGAQTSMTTTYYGDDNKPIEATSFLNHVQDQYDNKNNTHKQIWFDVAFGGKK